MPTSSRNASTSPRKTNGDNEPTHQVDAAGSIDAAPDPRDREASGRGDHGTVGSERHSPIAPGEWAEQVGTIVHVDPNLLHLVRNVRDVQPDQGLIDSIRDLGVLEPITALVYMGAKIEQTVTGQQR